MSKSLKLIIEALLFSSDKPLTAKDIKDVLPDTDTKDIKSALAILEHDFATLERSFTLSEVAGGYQLRSRPEYGSYILRMLQSTPNRLSRAAMETLAIVAYKQPILKHEVEKLRGVDVGGILKTLMEKDLVKIMGRKDLPGKPLIYGTTKRFLEVFDLKDISELPKMNEIKDFGLTAYEPTPLNRDNPLEPQGTEGLRRPDQEGAAPQEKSIENVEQEQLPFHVENTEEAEISIQPVDASHEENVFEEEPIPVQPDESEEIFEEDVISSQPDDDMNQNYEEMEKEAYDEISDGYIPDDDVSEKVSEDDPEN
jgi:segregation and condensation protein B